MKLRLALLVLLCSTQVALGQGIESPTSQDEAAIVTWLQRNAIPIHHVEAGNGFADLGPLKKVLEGIKIVGLGDATHGTREFYQIKHRLLEFLVTEMGFTALVLEAGYANCQPINDYVLYGKGDRATVLSGQLLILWDTEEISAMLDWLRTYNRGVQDEKKVRFYGVDVWSNDLGRKKVLRYLGTHLPGIVHVTDSLFQIIDATEGQGPTLIDGQDIEVLRTILPGLRDLIDQLNAEKARLVTASSAEEFDQSVQYFRVTVQWVLAAIAGRNSERSRFMAENLVYVVDHERPDAKFIIWQHNEHISGKGKETQVVGDGLINPYLGHHLRQQYGRQYYAFASEFNEGSYQSRVLQGGQAPSDLKEGILPPAPAGSLAWYLSRTGVGDLLLDLRTPPGSPIVERWLDTPQVMHQADWGYQDPSEVYTEVSIRRHYDGLIFVERTTATRPKANAWEAVRKKERF